MAILIILSSFHLFFLLIKIYFPSRIDYRQKKNLTIPISVIVAARNESKNLKNLIPKLIEQSYGQFELIIVNDRSSDDSKMVLQEMEQVCSQLHCIHIQLEQDKQWNKKRALKIGIDHSQYEHLVFTDADCIPLSKEWLNGYGKAFQQHDIVCGIGILSATKNLISAISSYESFLIAMDFIAGHVLGIHYMAVGRNMGFTKSFYHKTNPVTDDHKLQSGDDDLIFKNIGDEKIGILWERKYSTISPGSQNFYEFIKRKTRHTSTSFEYKNTSLFWLGTEYFLRYAIPLCFLFFLTKENNEMAFRIFILYCSLRFFIYFGWSRTLGFRFNHLGIPLYEFFILALYPIIWIKGKKKWHKEKYGPN